MQVPVGNQPAPAAAAAAAHAGVASTPVASGYSSMPSMPQSPVPQPQQHQGFSVSTPSPQVGRSPPAAYGASSGQPSGRSVTVGTGGAQPLHGMPQGTPLQPRAPAGGGLTSPWWHTFEAFFGADVCAGLRQGDDKARDHMFTQVWTHVNKNKLSMNTSGSGGIQGQGFIVFDEALVRLLEPVLPLGTSRCSVNDLW